MSESTRRYNANHPAECLLARDDADMLIARLRLGRGEAADVFPCRCPQAGLVTPSRTDRQRRNTR